MTTQVETGSKLVRGLMAVAMMLSIGYLGHSVVQATEEAEYSCCGNKSCSLLSAVSACPGGSSQCGSMNEEEPTCCKLACNDPTLN